MNLLLTCRIPHKSLSKSQVKDTDPGPPGPPDPPSVKLPHIYVDIYVDYSYGNL